MKNANVFWHLLRHFIIWYVSQYINICPDRESAFHRPSLGLYCMYDCASGTSLWLYAGIQAYPA